MALPGSARATKHGLKGGTMNRVIRGAVAVGILLTGLASVSQAGADPLAASSGESRAAPSSVRTPLLVVQNVGEFDARARYQVRGISGTLWLADDEVWLT